MRTALSAADGERLALSICAPTEPRLPLDIVCVVDKSGSMMSDATPGLVEEERDGITVWDLVVHCISVAIECLGDEDRVAVVVFDEGATLAAPMTNMTAANKKRVCAKLNGIGPSGGTQIWAGIHLGLETMRRDAIDGCRRNQSILVLTDGLDVTKPLRGNVYQLQSWIDANAEASRKMTLNTVGFGCALDSRELYEMADLLGGTFSHIPDASTAGTILINRCATDMATYGTRVCIDVTKTDGAVVHAPIGAIRVGQTRVHPIGVRFTDIAQIDVSYFDGRTRECTSVSLNVDPICDDAIAGWVKMDLAETLKHVISTCETNAITWALPYSSQQLVQFRKRNESSAHPYTRGCIDDIKDQLYKAVENEKWFSTWGAHYLRSYLHATSNEIVNNFRDKSPQHFSSPVFLSIQAHCESIFVQTPPIPKKLTIRRTSQPQPAARTVPAASASYQDRYYPQNGGGCFHPDALIYTPGGVMRIGQLRKGDAVSCSGGREAVVRCVVWSSGEFEMVSVDGFTLTPTHPVRNPDATHQWVFPKDISTDRSQSTRVVNLLLDTCHEIVGCRNDTRPIVCCTLAHGMHEDVVGHDYLGTDAVIRDLEGIPGFGDGCVEVTFTRGELYVSGVQH